jgi:hypothetical protein
MSVLILPYVHLTVSFSLEADCLAPQAMNTMNLLWGFNFKKPRNTKGEELTPDIYDYAHVSYDAHSIYGCSCPLSSGSRQFP